VISARATGKTAEAKLASWQAEKAKEIGARNARLKALQDAVQQNASVLGETVPRQRELEVERFSLDVQRFIEDARAEFLGVQKDVENAFLFKVRPASTLSPKTRGCTWCSMRMPVCLRGSVRPWTSRRTSSSSLTSREQG
jgi:hypothetical protein